MDINEDQKKKIIQALQEKGAVLPCPRCGNQNFTLIDGYFNQSLQKQISNSIIIGGSSVPSIGVVCNRCGFIAHHAIGVLGLMPSVEKNKNEAEKPTK